ncbi:MAG TPA: DNA-binding protein, partial [Spirochaetales bacterium]|nr:DNA-binding protein [Spirochaetales bacterium]
MDYIGQRDQNTLDIMTLSEVAQYLKLAEKTVLRMVHRGSIPAVKIASQWRFLRSVINE